MSKQVRFDHTLLVPAATPQIPAVGDLNRLRGALAGALVVLGASVARDDLHARMLLEPGRQGRRCAIGQHRSTTPWRSRSTRMVPPRRSVQSSTPKARRRSGARIKAPNVARHRVSAHGHAHLRQQPRGCLAAERHDHNRLGAMQPDGSAGVGPKQVRQVLGDCAP